MKKKSKDSATIPKPKKSGELGVTMQLLELKSQEVKSEVTTFRLETKTEFSCVRGELHAHSEATRSEFASVRSELSAHREETKLEFASVRSELSAHREETKAEFVAVRSEINILRLEMQAGFARVETQMTRMLVAIEEQSHQTKIALEAYTIVYEKLMEHESRFKRLENRVFDGK